MLNKLQKLAQDKYFLAAFLFFVSGLFLRLYKLNGFVTFLGDQGRDAIIIKRIVTFEHFPAIGPPTSVGQVYLGPFYYYFIAPWLLLFNFEPIGLASGVVVFSAAYLLINYFVVKDLFNKQVALISTLLVTFSLILIQFSRFSWNPNLVPLFTLLTVYFFIKALKKFDWRLFALAGAFLSFTIQLHYLALFIIPPVVILFIFQLFEQRKYLSKIIIGAVIALASFFIFSLPLVIFDLRHDFLNTNNFLKLLQTTSSVAGNKLTNIAETFVSLNKYAFNTDVNIIFSSLILILLSLSFLLVLRKSENLRTLLLFLILIVFGIALYGGPKYPHYFGIVYPLYYVVVAYFLSNLLNSLVGRVLVVFFLVTYIFLNAQGYYFFTARENNQINAAQKIAKVIHDNAGEDNFRLTALPQQYGDYTYRYFLEIWGKKPIEKGNFEKVPILFVVCETACHPIGDPQWDVAYFAPRKIVGTWKIDGATIYKLTR